MEGAAGVAEGGGVMRGQHRNWVNCDPKAMAYEQSDAAKMYAFQDAKAEILELRAENLRFRNIARAIAYPERGTPEEGYSLIDFATLLQSAYTAEQLYVAPEDRVAL